MSGGRRRVSGAQARRIALAAQGFKDRRPTGNVTERHFRRVLDRMTILQLDSVNVAARSHYLPLLARLGPYDRDRLDRWLWRSGENHEYLGHEASITSIDLYPLLVHRMARRRWKMGAALERDEPGYVRAVLDEVAEHGPLSVKELSDPGERSGPWWGYSKGKLCLEMLYVTGRLSIHHRTGGFTTVYDLPERVVPPELLAREAPDQPAAERELLRLAARSLGIATDKDLADYFRTKVTDARPILAELVAGGELLEVDVPDWGTTAYLDPEAAWPRTVAGAAFLSPFDPVVWCRPRAERMFGFEYRIEIYVPAPKRVYGYYVLPFLLDGDLVGRVDLKADRRAGRLLVKAAHLEDGHDAARVAGAMADQLAVIAGWLGLDEGVVVERRGDLHAPLRHAVG